MWGTLELPLSSSLCGFPLPSTAAHTRKHSHTLSVKAQSRIREMKTLDDTEFTRVESAVISRSSDALVLGSLLPYYYGKAVGGVADCFIVCAASMDCAAFMDNLRTETCSFKGPGGRVHEKRPGIDVYIRRQSTPLSLPTYRPVTPSSPPPPSFTWTALSANHAIFTVPNFVSHEEALQLIGHAERCFDAGAAPPNDRHRVSIGTRGGCEAGSRSVLFSRIEDRIAALTGLSTHEAEETIMISRSDPAAIGAQPAFGNLHHDKNNQERRVATVIVYLTTVDGDSSGGHLIFPTLQEPHSAAVRRAYARGARALGCRDNQESCGDAGSVVTHAANECERATMGIQEGIAIRPIEGMAVVFWSSAGASASGMSETKADPLLWHAACVERKASAHGRWVLQKFKTPPQTMPEQRVQRAARGGGGGKDEI